MPTKARNETRKIAENSLGAQRCEGIRTKQLFHIERRLLLFVDYVAVLDMLRAMMWCPHGSEAPQKPTALLRAQALSYIINNENPPPTIYGVLEVWQRENLWRTLWRNQNWTTKYTSRNRKGFPQKIQVNFPLMEIK